MIFVNVKFGKIPMDGNGGPKGVDSHGWEGEAEGGGLKSKFCLMVSFNERTKCRKT